jgi:SAM-dependent methyltransferase
VNPYDQLPYRSLPVPWTAPERLALCSLLHGGPRMPQGHYRVLELGCGDGANLLPMAFYRRHAEFVGIDSSAHAMATAEQRRTELQLANLRFVCADLAGLTEIPGGLGQRFDFIIMHGVYSWVPTALRSRLLVTCQKLLASGGLLYLNYNCKPGWNIRGMIRDFLVGQTASVPGLAERTREARAAASVMATSLAGVDHPYGKLMGQEFEFVANGDPSYVAHEFLAADNQAFWRSEFLAHARDAGLKFVADADFNLSSGRIAEGLSEKILGAGLSGRSLEDTVDLLSYRQLHSPVLTHADHDASAITPEELATLFIASPSRPIGAEPQAPWRLLHPTGFELEVNAMAMFEALSSLAEVWPKGRRLRDVFADCNQWRDDILLMHRYGTIALRLIEPDDPRPSQHLRAFEQRWDNHVTDPFHDPQP